MNEDIISKKAYTWGRLKSISKRKSEQNSFNIFSVGNFRGRIFNLKEGQRLEKVSFGGNLLITGLNGIVQIEIEDDSLIIEELDQLLINPQIPCRLIAQSDASIQLIWSPGLLKLSYQIKGL